jgi:hypothetical protein
MDSVLADIFTSFCPLPFLCFCPETSARLPNSTLIFRTGFVALFAGSGLPQAWCATNGRILLVILFPRDTAAVTVLDSRDF